MWDFLASHEADVLFGCVSVMIGFFVWWIAHHHFALD